MARNRGSLRPFRPDEAKARVSPAVEQDAQAKRVQHDAEDRETGDGQRKRLQNAAEHTHILTQLGRWRSTRAANGERRTARSCHYNGP
jgi:hypothetical protein